MKVPKKNAKDSISNDFRNAYAKVIDGICSEWIHDEDSSNNYSNVQERKVMNFGDIMVIFQAQKCDEDYVVEKAHILFIFKKSPPNNEIKKIIGELHEILVQDYQNMKKDCDGKWFMKYKNEDANNLLYIIKPLEPYKKNTWKMTFAPLNDTDGKGSRGWIPRKIEEILDVYDEESYQFVCDYIKN